MIGVLAHRVSTSSAAVMTLNVQGGPKKLAQFFSVRLNLPAGCDKYFRQYLL